MASMFDFLDRGYMYRQWYVEDGGGWLNRGGWMGDSWRGSMHSLVVSILSLVAIILKAKMMRIMLV